MNAPETITIFALVLFFLIIISLVISLHEAAHAYMANKLGDPTARLMGRMTLNPTAHIDPLGTVIVPLLLLFISQGRFVFGWAKPTPINPLNFRRPRQDSAITAFAGPASNFAVALVLGIISRLVPLSGLDKAFLTNSILRGNIPNLLELLGNNMAAFFFVLLVIIIVLNLLLGIFNLIPVPPLDGYKVLLGILPKEAALRLSIIEKYGTIVLLVFLFVFFQFFAPIISAILNTLLNLFVGTPF